MYKDGRVEFRAEEPSDSWRIWVKIRHSDFFHRMTPEEKEILFEFGLREEGPEAEFPWIPDEKADEVLVRYGASLSELRTR